MLLSRIPQANQSRSFAPLQRKRFDQLVEQALAELPPEFASRLDNVSIAVEDLASPDQLDQVDLEESHRLLGLYEGIPLTERDRGYFGALPDRITIFRIPIQEICHSDDEIKVQVRKTVMHELGHYFGMDEKQLRETDGGS
jgi:predicted Zn-dependent protease with MMP-like domain